MNHTQTHNEKEVNYLSKRSLSHTLPISEKERECVFS